MFDVDLRHVGIHVTVASVTRLQTRWVRFRLPNVDYNVHCSASTSGAAIPAAPPQLPAHKKQAPGQRRNFDAVYLAIMLTIGSRLMLAKSKSEPAT